VFETIVRLPLMVGGRNEGLQPLRDLDNVRSFLGGMGPGAFFDLPWLPFYLAICFAFHVLIGATALVGAIILVSLTIVTEFMSRAPAREAMGLAARRNDLAATSRRNAEVMVAMGMTGRLTKRWSETNENYLAGNQRASDVSGGLGAVAKVMRMTLQSAVLAVGAYLVIHQEATAGIIIAGSILSARALAPVDLAIAHWRGFVAARQSWHRLNRLLESMPPQALQTRLHSPSNRLTVESVSIVPPGDQKIIVQDVTFALEAGSGLGVIGPSGSGKSSLVRALVGVWQPFRGKVRLDGAALDQWSSDVLGRHIGYLPQDVELFAGTVAQNICRFDPQATADGIIAAAKEAGVHEMIIKMRDGYDTQIGEQGTALSAGQAQRVALARAVYGNPFLLVLDEPNSNLDTEGDDALTRAIRAARERGAIVVVVAHRPIGIEAVDQLLVLKDGRMQAFGPKETVLGQVMQRVAPPTPIKIVSEGGVAKS
jgi:ATP-binding cassette subfamily C protein